MSSAAHFFSTRLTLISAKFLTPEERTEVQRRMLDDCSLSDDFHLKYAIQAFRDWKIWVTMLITIGSFTPLYSISLFLPTIINELGYTANESQLMTVPVYVLACFCTICGSLASDKVGQRGPFIMGFTLISITGFVLLISSAAPRTQYAGTFLAAAGTSSCTLSFNTIKSCSQASSPLFH